MRNRQALIVTSRASMPTIAAAFHASPLQWAQIWAHEFSDAANRSRISTFRGRRRLPWAQGVAGSNPVAPTIHPFLTFDRICRHTIAPATTAATACITTYPAGVAKNSFTDLTAQLLFPGATTATAAVFTPAAALLTAAGLAATVAAARDSGTVW